MTPSLRKNLGRVVALMCTALIAVFAVILLNGTLIFSPIESSIVKNPMSSLNAGDTSLLKLDGDLVWATNLSTDQRLALSETSAAEVKLGAGCQVTQTYCLLAAVTERTGINLQYTAPAPHQLPNDLPWIGGFVNPLNGVVYDLLGRQYQFQGEVADLVVVTSSE